MQQYEKKHLAQVLGNAAECTVLLKKNGKFPVEKAGKVAAFGSGLRYTIKGGTGSGEVNSRQTFTIEEGLEKEGFEITSKKWLDAYDEVRTQAKKSFLKDLSKEAKEKKQNIIMYSMGKVMKEPYHELHIQGEGDTAIYVVSRNSGEGSDREVVSGDVKLSKAEVRDILALEKEYDKFMLVLNVGGVVDLSPVSEVGNILLLSQLGVDCGKVLADILTGKQNPSGKLTTTWAAWEDYSKEGTFGDWNETRYNEGIYVGYRYFDTVGKKALFPFGYGLSYTEFEVKTTVVSSISDQITVKVNVKNTGDVAGKEVVQVYVSAPEGNLDKAYQDLVGYAKTNLLQPEQEEELEIVFELSAFASYDESIASYVLERGDYLVRVGNSSANTSVVAVIHLDETTITRKVKNCMDKPDFQDVTFPARVKEEISTDAVRIALFASNLACEMKKEEVEYDVTYEIDERVKALSDEELVFLQIGSFDPNAKGLSIIGNAATHVAGAAGETTSVLEKKGIKPLIMADGPAGIRVSKMYYEDEKGAHDASGAGMVPESMLEFMNPIVRFIAQKVVGGKKAPKNAEIKEHMATMIPIGTAIAQSFNYNLAKSFGDLVGTEMEMMGIHLWLAPALNIHRSILCGRNFEYYSEDPLVSGLTAAAITEGVQAHKGCGTTIKHYAANNAETNRYCNNSQVSERAMREIYLRGFGVCVKKAQPHALMTSYNLLNGTHTAEHRGLIEDVLRIEFGFQGIVMTDWVIAMMESSKSVHRNSLSNEVAKAGGDLFMPGGKKDYNRVLEAIRSGTLSREQLEINATRVVRMINQLV
ncbi:MAG: glycoside hydrolase family 3 N-terminal domain-containing protein [Hespellia sp.]|nr:glycoside hydrolase family 3 N-terminal domain-containing protein [Hespellia sp.]